MLVNMRLKEKEVEYIKKYFDNMLFKTLTAHFHGCLKTRSICAIILIFFIVVPSALSPHQPPKLILKDWMGILSFFGRFICFIMMSRIR